ncbi:MAG: 50S ribosomal protein L10 [SAR202 cluster bacterium]|mgnify:CR=1 FL=1|nr:50S ribosomal protein L10 [Dehalococcoidia bacterium]MQF88686.1 50S ribosomal protein L10 [SAR202 cluster bacterium]
MPTQQKIDRVQDIKDRLERSSIVMTASYGGIPVNQMVELRRAMRASGVEFTIVKNTLLALAADEAQKPQLKEIVNGPTAIAFGYNDPVEAARAMADYVRTGGSSLAVLGAIMGDEAAMSPSEFTRLAALPPKSVLLAMLLGQMQSPLARLLTIMNGPLQSMGNVLQARVRQLEEQAPAPAPEPEASAEPEAAPEAEDAPADEAPADEAPTEGEPAAEATDDAPANEASAEEEEAEALVDEAPAEEEPEAEPEPEAEAAEEEPEAELAAEAAEEAAGEEESE